MSPRAVLAALTCVLALAALAGCGLEGQPFDTSDSTPAELGDAVVTPDAISEYPPNSPEAAVLRWWRAIQTRDTKAVIGSYSPKARAELPKDFAATVVAFVAPAASQAPIVIDYVESTSEDNVTVYAVISDSPDWRMNGPVALPMIRGNDRWLIADATFLDALVQVSGDVAPSETADSPPAEGSQ